MERGCSCCLGSKSCSEGLRWHPLPPRTRQPGSPGPRQDPGCCCLSPCQRGLLTPRSVPSFPGRGPLGDGREVRSQWARPCWGPRGSGGPRGAGEGSPGGEGALGEGRASDVLEFRGGGLSSRGLSLQVLGVLLPNCGCGFSPAAPRAGRPQGCGVWALSPRRTHLSPGACAHLLRTQDCGLW